MSPGFSGRASDCLGGLAVALFALAVFAPSRALANGSCDPAAGVVYAPTQGTSGLVLFEDRWPDNGDLDFNDQAIAYHYEFLRDSAGNVVTMQATFNLLAVGATLHNGIYLHLPLSRSDTPVLIADQGGNSIAPVQNETDLVIPIVNDTRSLFAEQYSFINTQSTQAVESGAPLVFTFAFANGAALDTSLVPYDLFISRSGDYTYQIHQPQYPGTSAMNAALFGQGDDRSNQDLSQTGGVNNSGRWFVNENGLPYALSIPEVIAWPQETLAIDSVYRELRVFASSAGAEFPNWYGEDINTSRAFTGGAGTQAPPSPQLPGADLSCVAGPPAFDYVLAANSCTEGTFCSLGPPPSTGGTITWFSISPELLPGLRLNPLTGEISGVPTNGAFSTDFLVTATNAFGTASQQIDLSVAGPILSTIGGSIGGLAGDGLVLSTAGEANLTFAAGASSFVFATPLAEGTAYSVSVAQQPSNPSQTCLVSSGDGTLGYSDVTGINVTCTTTYPVRGTVSNLTGSGLVLSTSGEPDLAVTTGSMSFLFADSFPSGTGYAVTVSTQPSNPEQMCTVANGSGILGGAATGIAVTCTSITYSLGGTVTGLLGSGLVLAAAGEPNLPIAAGAATFTFASAVAGGTAYSVTVLRQPATPPQTCSVANGAGTANADVANLSLVCVPLLSNRVDYPTASGPDSLAKGDFNGDGKLDLVAASTTSNTVSVLLGNGDGTFQSKVDYPTGSGPAAVAVGDFNGDGKLDLAVANSGANTVSIFLGRGDGTFNAKVDYATGAHPSALALADFNLDGKLDLAVALNTTYSSVSVLLGIGDGTFSAKMDEGFGGGAVSVAVADFNGDGKPDLVVANSAYNTIVVLIGKGDGSFNSDSGYSAGAEPSSVTVGDFNGDGKPDVAVTSASDQVTLFFGAGDGTFNARASYATASGPDSVTAGDFNGDGKADLVVANSGANTVSLFLGNGDGTFGANVDFPVGTGPSAVLFGDFNGDGKADLAVANTGSNSVSILLSERAACAVTSGLFGQGQNANDGDPAFAVGVADLNRDGRADLVGYTNVGNTMPGSLAVALGNGDGTFAASQFFTAGIHPQAIALGDFNRDGNVDAVVTNYIDGTASLFLGEGNGAFSALPALGYTGEGCAWAVAAGDFNGDGKLDLVLPNSCTSGVLTELGVGDGTFSGIARAGAAGLGVEAVAVGDFNGDGKLDIITADNASNTISLLLGHGDGTFAAARTYSAPIEPRSIAVADFNRDGKLDVVVAGDTGAEVFFGDGDGTLRAGPAFSGDFSSGTVAVADVNLDGKPDFILLDAIADSVILFAGGGDGSFTAVPLAVQPWYSAMAFGDFNGDGMPDLVQGGFVSLNTCAP